MSTILMTFAVPLTVPDVSEAYISSADEVNDTLKRMVLNVVLRANGVDLDPRRVEVTNGRIVGLGRNPFPTIQDPVVSIVLTTQDHPGIATAFDDCMGGYFQAGNTSGIFMVLVGLGALPPVAA